jgi:putative endonuclease
VSSVSRGQRLEALARRHLEQHGLRLLTRNFRCRGGELDLVMQDQDELVFVEVRGRRNDRFGSAAESVDRSKQQRLVLAAARYLQCNPPLASKPCRFDVVTLTGRAEDALRVDWIRDAFRVT